MNKKILIGLVIIIALVVGIYYFSQKTAVTPVSTTTTNTTTITTTTSTTTTPTNENSSPKLFDVTVVNFSFIPAELNIKKGDTVVWTNNDSAPHQIIGSNFQSDVLSKGQSFSFTFGTTGTFDYICKLHPSMKGKINVLQ
jgi:plastocyanin